MLEIGAIRKSNSLWASPMVLVHKKDGSLRLNARTVKDVFSLPQIEDTLDSLDSVCIFTSLDLKSGYWQVELDEESRTLRVLRMCMHAIWIDLQCFSISWTPA